MRRMTKSVTDRIRCCLRCEAVWVAHVETPKQCPRCRSPYWNQPRRKKIA